MGAEVVALGGDGDERGGTEHHQNRRPHPLGLGLLPWVAAKLEPAPEHRDDHGDRGDDVEGDHDRQDRVDRIGVRTRGARPSEPVPAGCHRHERDQYDGRRREQQRTRVARPQVGHAVSVPASGARIETASRSASKTTASTSPRSSPSTWSGSGRSQRTSIRSRSWP